MSQHGRHYRKGGSRWYPAPPHVADVEYGPVCPRCAGPKHRQSGMCATCYTERRRALEYPLPPVPARKVQVAPTGASRGRPQPQSHPWRKRYLLLKKVA